jgi:spore coat polysaccharide biosynthesis protein SpsF
MDNNIGIIIQARLSSTRLHKKILLEIEKNTTFLDVLLKRLSVLKKKMSIILATSNLEVDNVLESFSNKHGIKFFRGSEENVLNRFIKCAEENNLNSIIRICSDNPFIDVESILKLHQNYKGEDYLSYKINQFPAIVTHYGFFAEVVSLSALKKINEENLSDCIEHVTNCIYKNPNRFNVRFIDKNIENKNIRCTLDTKGDFENLCKLYFDIVKDNIDIGYLDIIKYIEKESSITKSMKIIIKENTK